MFDAVRCYEYFPIRKPRVVSSILTVGSFAVQPEAMHGITIAPTGAVRTDPTPKPLRHMLGRATSVKTDATFNPCKFSDVRDDLGIPAWALTLPIDAPLVLTRGAQRDA